VGLTLSGVGRAHLSTGGERGIPNDTSNLSAPHFESSSSFWNCAQPATHPRTVSQAASWNSLEVIDSMDGRTRLSVCSNTLKSLTLRAAAVLIGSYL
jgi:hypothetical protein